MMGYTVFVDIRVGDRVKLKGREPQGIVVSTRDYMGSDIWVRVDWDPDGAQGPKYVSVLEIDKVETCPECGRPGKPHSGNPPGCGE